MFVVACNKCGRIHANTDCETLRMIPVAKPVEPEQISIVMCGKCGCNYINNCPKHK
jgi:hypothetical protein